jgi:hypothetical protein
VSNYHAPTKHPITGAIEMADWLDDHDGKHRYGVRFPSDGKIYGGHECVEVRPREMMDEIERLRAALREVISVSDRKIDIYDRAKAALEGEKTND